MSRNEQGFGVIEILLIVCTVSVIGFIGWYSLQSPEDDGGFIATQTTEDIQVSDPASEKHEQGQEVIVAKNFITGMQTGNKSLVDDVLSPEFVETVKHQSGNDSYYDACLESGLGKDSCFESFRVFDLEKVTVRIYDLSEEAGPDGKTVSLSAISTLQEEIVSITFDFHLSPKGDTWQISEIIEARGIVEE